MPFATIGSIVFIFLINEIYFQFSPNLWSDFGFSTRKGKQGFFITSITAFLAHMNRAHLAGNLYFLWIFGEDVEEDIGPLAFLGLLFLSAMGGNLLYLMGMYGRDAITIGASGGIAGIMGYFLIRFPWHRFRYSFFYAIYTLPAMAMVGFFIASDLLGVFIKPAGVAHLAHLGGAMVGILWAMALKEWWNARSAQHQLVQKMNRREEIQPTQPLGGAIFPFTEWPVHCFAGAQTNAECAYESLELDRPFQERKTRSNQDQPRGPRGVQGVLVEGSLRGIRLRSLVSENN